MTDLFGHEDVLCDDTETDSDIFEELDAEAPLRTEAPPLNLSLIGYGAIEGQLVEAINANRLPHALIFAGDEGRGKNTMALRISAALLSKQKKKPFADLAVDDNDSVISKIVIGAHPDLKRVVRINKEGRHELASEIIVASVRSATQFMMLKPVEGLWRIVIVDEAHLMNEEAQNAFLKSLEEPPAHTVLILIAHQASMLLPTIRSRAQVFTFDALSENILVEQGGSALKALSDDVQEAMLRLSRGGIGAMQQLLTKPYISALEKIMALLSSKTTLEEIYDFSESWGTTSLPAKDPMGFLEEVLLDHCQMALYKALDEANGSKIDIYLGAIDELKDLFHKMRTRYLDKWQVIRQAFTGLRSYH